MKLLKEAILFSIGFFIIVSIVGIFILNFRCNGVGYPEEHLIMNYIGQILITLASAILCGIVKYKMDKGEQK